MVPHRRGPHTQTTNTTVKYDARKELKGWATYGYNDAAWVPAQRVGLPMGTLRAMSPNMKVVDTLKPISIN